MIKINYIELYASDLEEIKKFYTRVCAWEFIDYGPTYTAFTATSAGIDGGFEKTDAPAKNGALVVLYHKHLKEIRDAVVSAGGIIVKDIFDFPGGQRFHFTDPSGNELAVWSEAPTRN